MNDFLLVVAMAAFWWTPTFVCLSDLQRRSGTNTRGDRRLPRVVVWRWTAILCVPVVGAVYYWTKGRVELDNAAGPRGKVNSRSNNSY
jgi:hypothetical protein